MTPFSDHTVDWRNFQDSLTYVFVSLITEQNFFAQLNYQTTMIVKENIQLEQIVYTIRTDWHQPNNYKYLFHLIKSI